MAISGSGTANDPYIVSTWADFLTVVAQSGVYIKWAEVPNKTIDSITIDAPISIQATETDFNGWTFKNVTITITSGQVFQHTTNQGTAYNLHIEHLHFTSVKVRLAEGLTGYNIFIDELTGTELDKNDSYWTAGEDGLTGFTYLYLCNSIIKIKTKNACMRIPRNWYTWCEVYLDYKYELDNAVPRYNDIIMSTARFVYCYVSGKIDLRNGSGTMSLCRTITSPGQVDAGGIKSQGSVFNFETYVGSDSRIYEKYAAGQYVTAWSLTSPLTLFVTNNGNNYGNWALSLPNTTTTLGDLKNPEYLTEKGFQYIDDDLVRYPYYDKTNAYQDWTFRKSFTVNSGIPFLPFWKYGGEEPPEQNGEVDENPYITIYDMETKQNEFENHGLAVLRPSSGTITEELNGGYSLSLVHPRDAEGRWQYILEMNIIKALGQLFVIQKVDEVQNGGSAYVKAYAEHISYTLNDKWIFPPVTIAGFAGQTLIDSIMAQATDLGYEWENTYTFTVTTNMNPPEGFRDWYEMSDGCTPYELLIGGNGFVAKIGGELYRDNFNMSINQRMQGSEDNAFEMAVGYNLTGITRTVDLTTFCTYLRGYDITDGNYETWFAIGWDPSTLPRPYPREVVRSVNFTYDHPEYAEGQLERDTMNFFNQNCAPLVSYELNVVDLKRNPDYKMFTNNYRYKIGDKGRVWDERLQAWLELEITRTEKDIITGECKRVVIGTQRSFTRPVGYQPVIPRGIIIPAAERTIEGVPPLYFVTANTTLLDWIIYGAAGGVGARTINLFDFASWAAVVKNNTIDYQDSAGIRRGWGTWYDDYFTMTKNQYLDFSPWITTISAGNTLASQPQNIPTIALNDDGNVHDYVFRCKMETEVTGTIGIGYAIYEGTTSTAIKADEVFPDENGYITIHFQTDAASMAIAWGVDCDTYPVYSGDSLTFKEIMVVEGTEAPDEYVPYGYEIPVVVTQADAVYYTTSDENRYSTSNGDVYRLADDAQTKITHIPIAAPLVEGESISKTTTGIDINTFTGSNTLDITTTIKPRMKLTYKEVVQDG